jgi:hypothetical protein
MGITFLPFLIPLIAGIIKHVLVTISGHMFYK